MINGKSLPRIETMIPERHEIKTNYICKICGDAIIVTEIRDRISGMLIAIESSLHEDCDELNRCMKYHSSYRKQEFEIKKIENRAKRGTLHFSYSTIQCIWAACYGASIFMPLLMSINGLLSLQELPYAMIPFFCCFGMFLLFTHEKFIGRSFTLQYRKQQNNYVVKENE